MRHFPVGFLPGARSSPVPRPGRYRVRSALQPGRYWVLRDPVPPGAPGAGEPSETVVRTCSFVSQSGTGRPEKDNRFRRGARRRPEGGQEFGKEEVLKSGDY